MTPASTRTRDRRTEARQTAPVLCTPQRQATAHNPGTRDDTHAGHPREDPLTGSSGRRFERGWRDTKERSRGLINPSRRVFLRRQWGYPQVRMCVRGGSGLSESPPPEPVRLPLWKGVED